MLKLNHLALQCGIDLMVYSGLFVSVFQNLLRTSHFVAKFLFLALNSRLSNYFCAKPAKTHFKKNTNHFLWQNISILITYDFFSPYKPVSKWLQFRKTNFKAVKI